MAHQLNHWHLRTWRARARGLCAARGNLTHRSDRMFKRHNNQALICDQSHATGLGHVRRAL